MGRGIEGQAQRKLRDTLKLDPTFPEALTLYGIIEVEHQRWKSAEQILKTAIESDPSYSPAYVVLAGAYNTQEQFGEAQEATTRAFSTGGNSWQVRYEMARTFIGKGQYDEALAIIDNSLPSKDTGWLPLMKALALAGLQRYREADIELRCYLSSQSAARDLLEKVEAKLRIATSNSH